MLKKQQGEQISPCCKLSKMEGIIYFMNKLLLFIGKCILIIVVLICVKINVVFFFPECNNDKTLSFILYLIFVFCGLWVAYQDFK